MGIHDAGQFQLQKKQLALTEQLIAEQQRTNQLLQALVDMQSGQLVQHGWRPHPAATPHSW